MSEKLDDHDKKQGYSRPRGELVMLRVTNADGWISEIGSWGLPGGLIDNYRNQEEIGWHLMLALKTGASRVEVVMGQPSTTSAKLPLMAKTK